MSKLHEVVLSKNAVLLKGEKGLFYALRATDDATAKSWAEEFQTLILSKKRMSMDSAESVPAQEPEAEASVPVLSPSQPEKEAKAEVEAEPQTDEADSAPVKVLIPEIDEDEKACCFFGFSRRQPVLKVDDEAETSSKPE